MPTKVVDASALAAVLFGEPAADDVAIEMGDANLAAPALIEYEVGNTCWKKCRRYPEQAAVLRTAFGAMKKMRLQLYDVDANGVLALAQSLGITYYDASYVWLADWLDAPLVSLDKRLLAARAPSAG